MSPPPFGQAVFFLLPSTSPKDTSAVTHKVRVVQIEGEPWFVVSDVLRSIGSYLKANGNVNSHMALTVVDRDEAKKVTTNQIGGWSSPAPFVTVVSESGLYKLVMRSDKPAAKAFQDWVTREVLPSIRKTGTYTLPKGATIPLPQDIAGAFAELAASQPDEQRVAALPRKKIGGRPAPTPTNRPWVCAGVRGRSLSLRQTGANCFRLEGTATQRPCHKPRPFVTQEARKPSCGLTFNKTFSFLSVDQNDPAMQAICTSNRKHSVQSETVSGRKYLNASGDLFFPWCAGNGAGSAKPGEHLQCHLCFIPCGASAGHWTTAPRFIAAPSGFSGGAAGSCIG